MWQVTIKGALEADETPVMILTFEELIDLKM